MRKIVELVNAAFPNEEIQSLHDHGYWVEDEGTIWRGRRIVLFQLRDGARYCLKLANPKDEWEADFTSELTAYTLLSQAQLPVPRVIKIDFTKQHIETNYIILSYVEGVKLCTLWLQSDEGTKQALYRELGRVYHRIHQIAGKQSGLFKTVNDPYAVRFPVHPNDYMLDRELKHDSGLNAVQEKIILESTYHTIIDLWEKNLDYLKAHTPTLIHYSAFCWTIGFARAQPWNVSRFTGCGDMMWWDPAIDLSLFKYSHFMNVQPSHWEAFQEGYGVEVEQKRIALYGLFTKILAAMGVYHEPPYIRNPYLRNSLNAELEAIIEEIV